MIISKTYIKDSIYINLHAEESITSNFLTKDNSGIYVDRLQISTIKRINNELKNHQTTSIILDFNFIKACQANLERAIIELRKTGHFILFINIKKELCSSMHFDAITNSNNESNGDLFTKFYLSEANNHALLGQEINTKKIFEDEFKLRLKKHIVKYEKPHTSSMIYLSSFVNMKGFMRTEKEYVLYSLYRLSMKIKKKWKDELNSPPTLICQSLNSSYLVSILSTLLRLDILILDKVGPVNNLYGRIEKNINNNQKYIIVSDLVCLGTEVKIVKNIVRYLGGKCLGNVSLIKTETLNKSDIKSKNATISVFSIKKENNKELNYNITTDLEPIDE